MIKRENFVSFKYYLIITLLHHGVKIFYWITLPFRKRREKSRSPRRILFVDLGHLGDVLLATAAIRLARQNLKDAVFLFLTSPSGSLALKNNPDIQSVQVSNVPSWYGDRSGKKGSFVGDFIRYVKTLKHIRPDAIVNFRPTSYQPDHIAAWIAGIPQRIGIGDKGFDYLLACPVPSSNNIPVPFQKIEMIKTWLGISSVFPAKPNFQVNEQGVYKVADEKMSALGLEEKPTVGINPGAQHNLLWPNEYFEALCRRLHDQFKVNILFLGTHAHVGLVDDIRSKLNFKTYSLAGRTNVDELYVVLGKLKLLVTVDTGTRHLANAIPIPVIVLRHGADFVYQFGQYVDTEQVLIHPVVCSPCGSPTCPLGTLVCMTGIDVQRVFETAASVLGKNEVTV